MIEDHMEKNLQSDTETGIKCTNLNSWPKDSMSLRLLWVLDIVKEKIQATFASSNPPNSDHGCNSHSLL